MTKSDYVFQRAQRAHEEPANDPPWPLGDKPLGYCPWCEEKLLGFLEGGEYATLCPKASCLGWDPDQSEAENRARYAREVEADAKLEERIARESRKLGRGGDW